MNTTITGKDIFLIFPRNGHFEKFKDYLSNQIPGNYLIILSTFLSV